MSANRTSQTYLSAHNPKHLLERSVGFQHSAHFNVFSMRLRLFTKFVAQQKSSRHSVNIQIGYIFFAVTHFYLVRRSCRISKDEMQHNAVLCTLLFFHAFLFNFFHCAYKVMFNSFHSKNLIIFCFSQHSCTINRA